LRIFADAEMPFLLHLLPRTAGAEAGEEQTRVEASVIRQHAILQEGNDVELGLAREDLKSMGENFERMRSLEQTLQDRELELTALRHVAHKKSPKANR
jgi:hypothetical protein